MPQLVGKTVTEVHAALGGYPVVYLDPAGATLPGVIPGTSSVCRQQPAVHVELTGNPATLTVARQGTTC